MSHSPEVHQRPMIAIRDLVVFPTLTVPLLIGRPLSMGALQAAEHFNNEVILVTHISMDSETVNMESVYGTGVIGRIIQKVQIEDGTYKVLVETEERVKLHGITQVAAKDDEENDHCMADYEVVPVEEDLSENLAKVYGNVIRNLFNNVASLTKVPEDLLKHLKNEEDLYSLAVKVINYLPVSIAKKQEILEEDTIGQLVKNLVSQLTYEVDVLETQNRIQASVQKQMSKNQREYYLNEQIKAIRSELDDLNDTGLSELDQLEEQIIAAKMPKEAEEKALLELKRLKSMPAMSSEGTVARTYIDWLLKMPWNQRSRLKYDITKAEERLDQDHSGLDKVKDRILEYLAVTNHTKSVKGNILCLIGPPGVGKTTLARSIAEATGRELVRMSLGGVHDESEIRGHRRTYIGALPGKIVQMLAKAKTKNPLMLLDEIDKMGSDYKGDPAHAMLEVLDPEQNSTFNDHYLDVDVDLSEVMFIATANSFNIPGPLRDRMEIIELSSYTELEKLDIAKNYLLPKQLKEHKLKENAIEISDDLLLDIIRLYTKEAGVRSLDRQIAKICRKAIKDILKAGEAAHKGKGKAKVKVSEHPTIVLTKALLEQYLGVPRFRFGVKEKEDQVGYVNGLAWTQLGGELLGIEVEVMPGKGNLITTGSLGDVMKESMRTAMSLIRARAKSYGLADDFADKIDIHVHAPEGAVPKDGPSAGGAITVAILSALLNQAIRADIGMTGEVTLRGHILAIGGLKEKLLAAARAGLKKVLIPEENVKDLEDVPAEIKAQLTIIPVSHFDEVVSHAFVKNIEKNEEFQRYSGLNDFSVPVTNVKSVEKHC
ncbi:endopeptidase La [Wohlfahrtiimonas chitiniclastica]|uniref:Lon protease n=2 Tax=Wohlfahrtiimonas chitiniclastica TaxID=400946 RepID=L8XZ74_9GAMM|nr:endopeptidase La [Wohlfahrtiimonas chitiniclastica]ELV08124.1 Lon protease [Wohlfahrtiimonas chitiniclastica SH04]KZX37595.1 endopeptidase La [Wohlfahrtiimonas chitiniclastica]MBS7817570.1 endopeptidase La [Wohlfahrtiimonas chitiniclastica]MBS7821280.1 endopeptidase La [Wohlfahrtiimonas chitiniclastica]MBS7823369.1 endopeptidase La [Wohlfahrtiimonas chitiniclastica]